MSKLTKNDLGKFTYCWGMDFFIETEKGNFLWKDPEYGGDNTISPYKGSLGDFLKGNLLPYGRDKGSHKIGDYCENAIIA